MKNTLKLAYLFVFTLVSVANAEDWSTLPVPAEAGEGMKWQLLDEYSDSFNYRKKDETFTKKWRQAYVNTWLGPGRTKWQPSFVDLDSGKLVLSAAMKSDDTINMGIISSPAAVTYPVFIEASIKPANLELSSNLWMISQDQTQELDVLEIYGGSAQEYFAKRAASNFHIFYRDAVTSDILRDYADSTKITTDKDGGFWREDFHRFGVYWKSPTEVSIFYDGKKNEDGSWKQAAMFDKSSKTDLDKEKYNISKPMYIVLDLEEHDWRFNNNKIDTKEALSNPSKNKMYVDWIRVYKPVAK